MTIKKFRAGLRLGSDGKGLSKVGRISTGQRPLGKSDGLSLDIRSRLELLGKRS